MINEDILVIAKQAGLKISANNKIVHIRHTFRLGNKSIAGVFLLLIAGVFLMMAPFIKMSEATSKILGVVIGLTFFALAILTLIRQVADGLKITNRVIVFRFNLQSTSLLFERSFTIKMKTEIREISRVGTTGSAFIVVTHYLTTTDKEIPILTFQMDKAKADKAIALGNYITRIINEKFRHFN